MRYPCPVVIRKVMLHVVVFIITTLAVFIFFVINPLYWEFAGLIALKLNIRPTDTGLALLAVVLSILGGVVALVNAVREKPPRPKDASIPPRKRRGRGNYHE